MRNHHFRLWDDFDSSDVAFTAEQTTKEINVTDLPFLALALALSSPIWTNVVHLKWRRLQYRERALHWAALWYSKPPTLIKETVVAKLWELHAKLTETRGCASSEMVTVAYLLEKIVK